MLIRTVIPAFILGVLALNVSTTAYAEDTLEKAKAVTDEDGKYYDAEGNPTFKIENGMVDWYTFSGYRRYHSDCHVCHGQDGMGSTYAPALVKSLKNIDYGTFLSIVAGGKKEVGGGNEKVMPAFGDNKNVYCYMDDIYVYLRARADGAAPRGRPPKHDAKSQATKDAEAACMAD